MAPEPIVPIFDIFLVASIISVPLIETAPTLFRVPPTTVFPDAEAQVKF